MEHILASLPLALLTTLSPLAVGAFVALACAFLTTRPNDVQLGRIDRWTLLPLAVLVMGFVASSFHPASSFDPISLLERGVRGALSAQTAAGLLFAVLAFAYWVIALTGKLPWGARRVMSCIGAIVGIVFVCCVGLAGTWGVITSANVVLMPLSLVGFSLGGGVPLGTLVLALAGGDVLALVRASRFRLVAVVAALIGVIAAFFAVTAHLAYVQSLYNPAITGLVPVEGAMVFLLVVVIGLIAALATERYVLMPSRTRDADPTAHGAIVALSIGVVGAFVGILAARLLFYALQVAVML